MYGISFFYKYPDSDRTKQCTNTQDKNYSIFIYSVESRRGPGKVGEKVNVLKIFKMGFGIVYISYRFELRRQTSKEVAPMIQEVSSSWFQKVCGRLCVQI